MAEKHEQTGHYVNDYGQVTDTCSCGANVDNFDAHVADRKRVQAETKDDKKK